MKRLTDVTRSGRKNYVVMLTRYPRLGEVKTRLAPPLSPEDALALHDRLTRHTLRSMLALQATGDARAQVRTDAAFARVAYDWLGHGFAARYQGEGDLGDRIRLAFGEAFARGAERVVVVGSDCPRLTAGHLRDALARLDKIDVVLGPADDGGYYLVALGRDASKRSVPVLFSNVALGHRCGPREHPGDLRRTRPELGAPREAPRRGPSGGHPRCRGGPVLRHPFA